MISFASSTNVDINQTTYRGPFVSRGINFRMGRPTLFHILCVSSSVRDRKQRLIRFYKYL